MKNWQMITCSPAEFCPSMVRKILKGKSPGVRLKEFISPGAAEGILRGIHEVGLEYYVGADKAGGEARKGKLGPNFFRFKDQPAEYFARVEHFRPIFREEIFRDCDPAQLFREACAKAFEMPAQTATEGGKEFMVATVRDLPAAPVHFDWLPSDCPKLELTQRLTEQFAWNLFLELPENGGYTLIHNHDARDTTVFPKDSLWAGVAHSRCDLTVFRSTYRHLVIPSEGSGSRITVSGFFGIRENNLVFWV